MPRSAQTDEIRQHGHWAVDIMLRHYAKVLPLGVQKAIAFYAALERCYFLARQAIVLPPGMMVSDRCAACILVYACMCDSRTRFLACVSATSYTLPLVPSLLHAEVDKAARQFFPHAYAFVDKCNELRKHNKASEVDTCGERMCDNMM